MKTCSCTGSVSQSGSRSFSPFPTLHSSPPPHGLTVHREESITSRLSSSGPGKFQSKSRFAHAGTQLLVLPCKILLGQSRHSSDLCSVDGNRTVTAMRPFVIRRGWDWSPVQMHILSNSRAWKSTLATTPAVSGERGSKPGEKKVHLLRVMAREEGKEKTAMITAVRLPRWTGFFPAPQLPNPFFLQISIF